MSDKMLASERLPTVAPGRSLTISYTSTEYNTTTRVFKITYSVTAVGMKGKKAKVYLMPAEAEPDPDKYAWVQYAMQPITLADGCYDFTLNVSEADVPTALGVPPLSFYLLIVSGLKTSATPQTFTFVTPTQSVCDCGKGLGDKFATDRYSGAYGPVYKNIRSGNASIDKNKTFHAVDNWDGWPQLIKSEPLSAADIAGGFITEKEKDRIIIVATNESFGYFDTVQGYDNQPLTVGAMQKTVRPRDDQGEFSQQLYEFKQTNPILFKCLIGDCGWEVTHAVINGVNEYPTSWTDPKTRIKYTKSSAPTLFAKIREGYTEATFKNNKRYYHPALSPLIRLAQHPDFKKKQIDDFVVRLRKSLNTIPVSSVIPANLKIRADQYFTTEIGRALILDQIVNRKNTLATETGRAIKAFLAQNPTIPVDPREWGSRHEEYEKLLIKVYGPNRDMTDPEKRYNNILKYYKSKN